MGFALALALTGAAALYVALGVNNPWDFETYYHAASACRAHLDPYDLSALSSVAGKHVELPFLYPPVALAPFLALSFLPLPAASLVWLGLKVAILAGLLMLWRASLLSEIPIVAFIGVALFGFNAAALWDLRTGNVAIVEAVLLWAGFFSYRRARTLRSAWFIAAASIFKVVPIGFLGLLLLGRSTRRKKVLAVAFGVALLAAVLVASWPLTMEWVGALARSLVSERPIGEVNPSALGILDSILGDRHRALALPLFGIYVCAIAFLAFPMLRGLNERGSPEECVIAAVVLWILLSPRVMIYSYILMVVPGLVVIRHAITSSGARALGYLLLMAQGLARLLPGPPPAALAEGPFFLTLGVFALLVTRNPSIGFLRRVGDQPRAGSAA